jgi:hypothetical protein
LAFKVQNLKKIEVCTMKLTTRTAKLISVIMFLLFASSLILMKGCGTKSTGGCPDGAAPDGSTITAPSNLSSPFVNTGTCYPALNFIVKDKDGSPLNGICVEVFSDANIALHSGLPDCSNVIANPQTSIITRTDDHGVVSLELLSGPTPSGGTHFVEVVSGAITAIATTGAAK